MDREPKYKTSQEAFLASIKEGEERGKKMAEKSRQIRELDAQLKQIVAKSTFTQNEFEKKRLVSEAQTLKKRIDMLRGL